MATIDPFAGMTIAELKIEVLRADSDWNQAVSRDIERGNRPGNRELQCVRNRLVAAIAALKNAEAEDGGV
jgi:hypothetical protein